MRLWLKILLAVLAGFGGGFAAGFTVHKKLNDVNFEEVTEEDLDKLLEALPENVKKLGKGAESAGNGLPGANKGVQELPNDPDKLRNTLQGKTPFIQADEEKKQEYSKIWNTVKEYSDEENANELPTVNDETEDEEAVDEEDPDEQFMKELTDDIPDERMEPEPKSEPYQISLGEFYEERREYDKITIDWWDEDDIALDEREEIIPDISGYIGCEMKELFRDEPKDGDPDSRFVRNDRYSTDYEVIRHHGSWLEASGNKDD